MKWVTQISKIKTVYGIYWVLPCVSFQYSPNLFLETGVYTPAFMLQISFLNFTWGVTIQKSYKI